MITFQYPIIDRFIDRLFERRIRARALKLLEENSINLPPQKQEIRSNEFSKLNPVTNQFHNGMVVCAPDGTIEWINDGMIRLLGFTLNEIKNMGNTIQEVSSFPGINEIIEKCILTMEPVIYETTNTTKWGETIVVQSTLSPVIGLNNELEKLIIIDTDITQRKKEEEAIKQRNKDVTDSIVYAKRIQAAMFPMKEIIYQTFPDSFIFHRPKDIVSGDFYGFTKKNDKIFIAVADCTGHGVPGAFMSMIGINILNQLIGKKGLTEPSEILHHLHNRIRSALHQEASHIDTTDGMDIALCSIDLKKKEIEFAGAMRPMYIIRKDDSENAIDSYVLKEIKGDKHSIGGRLSRREGTYSKHIIGFNEGDTLYLFTDGYSDQFGGPKNKKFMARGLREMLLKIQPDSMKEQHDQINDTFVKWKGLNEQVDDILVMGVRL